MHQKLLFNNFRFHKTSLISQDRLDVHNHLSLYLFSLRLALLNSLFGDSLCFLYILRTQSSFFCAYLSITLVLPLDQMTALGSRYEVLSRSSRIALSPPHQILSLTYLKIQYRGNSLQNRKKSAG